MLSHLPRELLLNIFDYEPEIEGDIVYHSCYKDYSNIIAEIKMKYGGLLIPCKIDDIHRFSMRKIKIIIP